MLLTDADIVHDRRHVASLVAHGERSGCDLVSEMVALDCASRAEHALVPAFVFFFQLLYPFDWVNDPLRATAAAAGGTILIRTRALRRIGGVAAVRGALIDDVALAGAVKRGGRIWLGHSGLARSVRSLSDGDRYLADGVAHGLCAVALLAAAVAGDDHGDGSDIPGAALCRAVRPWRCALVRLAGLGRNGSCVSTNVAPVRPIRPLGAVAAAIAAFYLAATIGSAVNHHFGRGVAWKGRAYQGVGA